MAAQLKNAGHDVTTKPGWMGEFRIKVDGREVFQGGESAKAAGPEAIVRLVEAASGSS